MKAVTVHQPQNVTYTDVPTPVVTPKRLIVKVEAVGICMSDIEIMAGTRPEPYIKYPVIPGHEWSGTVVNVGPDVTGFSPGMHVAVEGHNYCRVCFYCQRGETNLCIHYNETGFTLPGGYAEYVSVRADLAHPFGEHLSFEAAALTEPAACAGHGVLRANIQPGDTVVIVGPGTIGLLAVAWAKLFSPAQIIVVGLDRTNEAKAKAVGASHFVIADEHPADLVAEITEGRGADVVVECAGQTAAVATAFALTRRGGTLILIGIVGGNQSLPIESDIFCLNDLQVHGIFAYSSAHFVKTLRLINDGLLNVAPLITHRFPLEKYQDAFQLLDTRPEPVVKVLLKPN